MDATDTAAAHLGRKHPGDDLTARPHLDPRSIVATAVDHVERHGLAALTMRRLATELGVEAMSIYHHIASRNDLLDAMVEHLLDTVDDTLGARLAETARGDWSWRAVGLATALRHTALTYPRTFPLVLNHGVGATLFRPPLRRASWYEALLNDMTQSGMGGQVAARTCHRLASFLLGYLLLEVAETRVAGPASGPGVDGELHARQPRGLLAAHPSALMLMSQPQTDAEFAGALKDFLIWAGAPRDCSSF